MTVTLVQSVASSHTGANTASDAVTITSTTAGNLLLVAVDGSNNTVTYSISVTGTAQTFVTGPSSPDTTETGNNAYTFYVLSCAAGTTGITITRSTGTGRVAFVVEEWNTSVGTWGIDVSAISHNTLQTALLTGTTGTSTVANELWWGWVACTNATAAPSLSTPTNGFTAQTIARADNAPTNTAFQALQTLNKIVSATGTAGTGMTASATQDAYVGQVLTFSINTAADAGYNFPVQVASRYVGPPVLRREFGRRAFGPYLPTDPVDPGYFFPVRIANQNVGPTVLRRRFHPPPIITPTVAGPTTIQKALTAALDFVGAWFFDPLRASAKSQTITALTSPFTAQNGTWSEYDILWYGSSGGWKMGYIPSYGGGLVSSWYELDSSGNEVGQNNDNLATTRPDGIIHVATVLGGVFIGSEENPFSTPTEQAPVGTGFRRGLQIRVPIAGEDSNGFDYTVTDYIYPGNPGFRVVRMDQNNPSTATLDGTNAFEFAMVAGLNSNASEWPLSNSGYGTVGGSVTSPLPTVATSGEPDYMYSTPGGSAGKIVGVVGVKKTAIADSQYTGVSFLGNTNATPRTKLYYQANVTTVAAAVKTHRVITAFRLNLTQAEAVSIAADVKTPDASFTNILNGTFTSFNDDEGLYVFASTTGNSIQFQHSISGNVTKRWLCIYKITGWTASNPKATLGGVGLTLQTDYITYVDTVNQIAYVKLMKGIVASGAGAGELNNAIITIATSNAFTAALTAALSFTGATVKATRTALSGAVLSFTGTISNTKIFNQALAATLSFAGAFIKLTNKSITATLSFTGITNLLKAITKGMTATLSFTGTQLRAIRTGLTATLSFVGAILKTISSKFTATLSFTGGLAALKAFGKLLSATLSFTGTQVKQTNKGVAATLSFSGATLKNAITKGINGGLGFAGSTVKAVRFALASASLSFTGAATKRFNRALTATLSFVGTQTRAIGRPFAAALSFAGARSTATTKGITASLSFVGTTVKQTRRALAAALSFTGTFTPQQLHQSILLALNATLGFTGSVGRGRVKILAASMRPTAVIVLLRWYMGIFKFTSQGTFRAVSRTIRNILTKNRNNL